MFDIDWVTILFEALNFLVLSAILYQFLFKRVIAAVKEQSAQKEALLQKTQEDRREAAKFREEIEERLSMVDQEIAEIINQAQAHLEVERKRIMQETQDEVARILEGAIVEANQIQRQSLEDHYEDLINAVVDLSAQAIGKISPDELQDALVEQVTKRVWEMGRGDMQEVEVIRHSLGERNVKVFVDAPRPLTPQQQRSLAQTFSALADKNVNLEIRKNTNLALGLKVRMGDLIIDNSIRSQLGDLHEEVSKALKERLGNG